MRTEGKPYSIAKANVLFGCVHGLYWAGCCMSMSFLVTYLTQEGYSTSVVGLLTSLMTLLSIVVQPVLGYLSDTYVPVKVISLGLLAVLIPMALLIPKVIGVPLLASVIIVLMGLLTNTLSPLLEVWTIRSGELHPGIRFGVTRSMGSVGYSFLALFMGRVFERIGLDQMFLFNALLFGALILVILAIPGIACANRNEGASQDRMSMVDTCRVLLKRPAYVWFLLFLIFLYSAFKTTTTFYPVLIEAKAGTSAASALGVGLFISSLSEMPSMMFSDKLIRRFGPEKLMVVAVVGYLIRFSLYLFAPDVLTLQLANLTQLITYGILYPCTLAYLRRLAPQQVQGTAITATLALANTVSSVLGPMVFGVVIEYVSMELCLVMCTVLALCSMGALQLSRAAEKRRPVLR